MLVSSCRPGDAVAIARELARRLRQCVDAASFEVILYGSYARGTPDAESDVDILVRYDGNDTDCSVEDAALRIACDLTLEHGVLVSVLVADRALRERHRGFSFFDAVERDGMRP